MTEAADVIRSPGRRAGGLASIVAFAALVVLAGAVLFPVFATALNGFKDLSEFRTNPFGLPHVWQWSNYWDILTGSRYWQGLGNSLLIAFFTVTLTLVLSAMAAFTFAHLRFFGDRFLMSYIQLGLLFPLATAIVPIFIRIRGLGLLDSAMMDGCGYFRYFLFITLPLSGPILATVAVISFVESWNGYLLPLIVLNSESRYPWTLGLMAYQGQYMTSWQLVLAFITLTILPAILMFLMAQRYIVAGLTAGAVKA